jgi:hypothetical protein
VFLCEGFLGFLNCDPASRGEQRCGSPRPDSTVGSPCMYVYKFNSFFHYVFRLLVAFVGTASLTCSICYNGILSDSSAW